MVFLFFPTMTIETSCLQQTAFFILTYESSCLPILTQCKCIVIKYLGLSSEVLLIVSIITLRFVMFFIKWTPFSFEVKHVKIHIFLKIVYNSSFYVFHRMCKWAIVFIITVLNELRKLCTKFRFVLLNMIQSFNSVMSELTIIFFITSIGFRVFTKLRWVIIMFSSPIFDWMEKLTMLVIMLVRNLALFYFKFR